MATLDHFSWTAITLRRGLRTAPRLFQQCNPGDYPCFSPTAHGREMLESSRSSGRARQGRHARQAPTRTTPTTITTWCGHRTTMDLPGRMAPHAIRLERPRNGRLAHVTVRRSAGAAHIPERPDVNFLAPLDLDTLALHRPCRERVRPLAVVPGRRGTPDVQPMVGTERALPKRSHRHPSSTSSISASRNGRRVVATAANPTASLWRVPIASTSWPRIAMS